MNARIACTILALGAFASGCDNDFDDKPKAAVESDTTTKSEGLERQDQPASAEATTLQLDKAQSSIGFVGAKITGKHEGSFDRFAGNAKLEGGELTALELEIATDSVKADVDKLTSHLKSEDFFHTDEFPEARFESTKIERKPSGEATHEITGSLTLRGVTKTITFPAKIRIEDRSVTGEAEFTINRKDFGIEYRGMPDDLIKDEVLLDIKLRLSPS